MTPMNPKHGEERRADRHEEVGPHPGRMTVQLALQPDDRAEERRDQQPGRQAGVVTQLDHRPRSFAIRG
jgi:hypothetical protein